MAESSSSNFSSSSSTPTVVNTPQSDFLLQLAQYAQGLAQSSSQWANNAYARGTGITDQSIGDYRNVNAKALQLAQNDTQRYQQLFQPEENQLLQDANTYASPNRMAVDMGAAASGQAQAGDAALQNARQKLQSYGIDPSSGRYADLEHSERTKTAAAAAGAAQQARLSDEATGRALRSEAIQVGERYPGQIINSLNTGLQATTGAQNAEMANENTGANVMRVPQDYVQAGMGLKLPLMGNQSQSQGSGQSSGSSPDRSGGGGGNPGGNSGSSNAGSGDFMNPNNYGSYGGGPGIATAPDSTNVADGSGFGPDGGFGTYNPYDQSTTTVDPWQTQTYTDPLQNTGGGTLDEFSGWGDTANSGAYSQDYSTPSSFPSVGDGSSFSDASSFGGSDGSDTGDFSMGFAQGGAIPASPTSGGGVSPAASPSGGQQTDDVNAHLNAGEFVLPRDIVAWKGQEFFQKLIQDARAKMGQAPAQGKPSAPRPGPATFRSQAIPAG